MSDKGNDKNRSLEISMASLDGQFRIIKILLTVIVALSGWTTIMATKSQETSAVLNSSFSMASISYDKNSKAMMRHIIELEEKDREKRKRIEKIESVCIDIYPEFGS